jgi:hypothetical protein
MTPDPQLLGVVFPPKKTYTNSHKVAIKQALVLRRERND